MHWIKYLIYFLKQFLIILLQAVLLIFMLLTWSDKLHRLYWMDYSILHFLGIVGISSIFVCVLFFQIIKKYSLQKELTLKKWFKKSLPFYLIFYLSFYPYYSYKLIQYKVIRTELRERAYSKIEYISPAVHHSRGVNMTYEEYQEVFKNFWKTNFLPSTAYDISYELIYDDFLGDYGFTLDYHLPLSESIEEVFNRGDSFTEIISVDTTDSDKIIRHEQHSR